MSHAKKILSFLRALEISRQLPEGVEVLNPYVNDEAFGLCRQFYEKYYNDNNGRQLILGINPGRWGGGLTGIPFTDPIKLEKYCEIPNDMPRKAELSADFIYAMIAAYGGPLAFYSQYYFSSVSPLGFTKEGRNLNYYDIRELQDSLKDFIVHSIKSTLQNNIDRSKCFCLGEGQNFKYLQSLNKEFKFFEEIIPLSHPRFVMQYKRKSLDLYIADYLKKLSA